MAKKKLETLVDITLDETKCVVIGEHRQMTEHVIRDIVWANDDPEWNYCVIMFEDDGWVRIERKNLYGFAKGDPVKDPKNGEWVVLKREDNV